MKIIESVTTRVEDPSHVVSYERGSPMDDDHIFNKNHPNDTLVGRLMTPVLHTPI